MSFKAPQPKVCAYCGKTLESSRSVTGQLHFRNVVFSVGWHMPESATIDAPSCYDIDEALADPILSDVATMADGATAIETLLRERPGRVLRSMRSLAIPKRQRKAKRDRRRGARK